jgi:hypothetical protein
MRKKLTVLVAGLAAAGALVMPEAAHAATAKVPGTLVACTTMQNDETGKWATDAPDHDWLYFEGTSDATIYCFYQQSNGLDEIEDQTTGNCLAENTSARDNGNPEVDEESCGVNASWDQWGADAQADYGMEQVLYNFDPYKGVYQCLYDYTQEPAIVTACPTVEPTTDYFFWFLLGTY